MDAQEQMANALAAFSVARSCVDYHAYRLRDARRVGRLTCRLTIGTMVLLSDAENAVWTGDDVEPIDVMQFAMLTSDEWRDDCLVSIDKGKIDELTDLFCSSMRKRTIQKTIDGVLAWITPREDRAEVTADEEPMPTPSYWWETAVDAIASEYGWDEEYILWHLPYDRASGYLEAAQARRSGKDTRSLVLGEDQSANMLKALQDAQKAHQDGTQSKT